MRSDPSSLTIANLLGGPSIGVGDFAEADKSEPRTPLGHETGDEILKQTATRLLAPARAQDTVSRIGGDEFVILCENTTAEEADILADRILKAIRAPSRSRFAREAPVTVSIGITTANLSFDAADLLRQADAAMYRAKERGRDQLSR